MRTGRRHWQLNTRMQPSAAPGGRVRRSAAAVLGPPANNPPQGACISVDATADLSLLVERWITGRKKLP